MSPGVVQRLNAALEGRYRIEGEIGEGGMATVYVASDVKHERRVAIKVLKPELAAVVGGERFLAEIRTTANLQHPHILPLFDSGEADGFLFYVMPYVDGESLRERLERERQLGVEEAVRIAREVADALDYAHRQGIVHRDIKPANILLHDGRPLVADFGIALAVRAASGGRMTETGTSLGTPHYMSPEQATADPHVTGRSDVYSLGCVLYEMLAGHPPHTAGSAQQVIAKIIAEPPRPVTDHRGSVPPNVADAVTRALEKLPADRFGSAEAFAEALADPDFRVVATRRDLPSGAGSRSDSRGARVRDRALVSLAAAALLALGLAAWGWLRPAGIAGPETSWATELPLPEGARLSGFPSISRDGSFLVYGGASENGLQLWLRRAASPEPAPLPGGEGGYIPAVSPDGRRIAFQRDWRIRVMPAEGGASTLVASTNGLWDRLAWTDDEHLVFPRRAGLARFPVSGGEPEAVTRVDSAAGERIHAAPSALPDGGDVVFTVIPEDFGDLEARRIAAVGPEGGAHSVLVPGVQATWGDPDHLIIVRADGSVVAVPYDREARRVAGEAVPLGLSAGRLGTFAGYPSVAEDGRMVFSAAGPLPRNTLVRVGRSGEVIRADSSWGRGLIRELTASEDGSRVAARMDVFGSARGRWLATVIVRDLETGASSRLDVPDPGARYPVFTPDGALLYSTPGAIHRAMPGAATEPERLVETEGGWPADLGLSPDGRTVYYVLDGDILAYRVGGGPTESRAVVAGEAREADPSPSPDGRWLAYTSDESGRTELYVRSTDPSRAERWQVSRAGAAGPVRWSADGGELYYRSDLSSQQYYGLARDSLMAARLASGSALSVGERRGLFPVRGYEPAFAVLPGGDFLLIAGGFQGGMRLMMVEDWKALPSMLRRSPRPAAERP